MRAGTDMAHQQPRAAMPPMEAVAWASSPGQACIGTRDAAILSKIQLQADETGILHVGSAGGTFAITACRVLGLIANEPVKIVGIDNSQTLVDVASSLLDSLADMGQDGRALVQFRHMDAFGLGTQENIDTIQALFPRGISTIVATDVFDDLSNAATRHAIRDLAALLNPGGRVFVCTQYQPRCWSAAGFFRTAGGGPSLVGVVNLAPRRFSRAATEQVHARCGRIAGTSSTGVAVAINGLECAWMGRVLGDFINTSTLGLNPPGLPVSDEACFDPVGRQFYNALAPGLRFCDGSNWYCRLVILELLGWMQSAEEAEEDSEWRDARKRHLEQMVFHPDGLASLNVLLEDWLDEYYMHVEPNIAHLPRPYQAVHTMIDLYEDEVNESLGITGWDEFHLAPASVMVSFRRA